MNIIWEGNQDWDKRFETFADEPIPENAAEIKTPKDKFKASVPYMILPCLICMVIVFIKTWLAKTFLFNVWFVPLSFLIGFLVALPVHEYLHALCYPKEAKVYVGVDLKRMRAYAMSFYPISKIRYIIMSLAPVIPGLIALTVFLICPPDSKAVNTLCVMPMFMSLLSPAPDYLDVLHILKQVPSGAKIQATKDSLYWFH